MSRCNRRGDRVPQHSIYPQIGCLKFIAALALLPLLNAPAQAGSTSATLQVRARVVTSCRVSTTSLDGLANTAQGRFNCPTTKESSTSSSAGANSPAANYTVSDVPDTGGSLKLLTLNF